MTDQEKPTSPPDDLDDDLDFGRAALQFFVVPATYITNLPLARISTVYDDRICSRLAGGTIVNLAGDRRRERVRPAAGALVT